MTPSHEQIVDHLRQILAAIPEGDVLAEISMTEGASVVGVSGPMGMPPYGLEVRPGMQRWQVETFGPLAAGAIGPGKPERLISLLRKRWVVYRTASGGVELALTGCSAP